MLCRAATQMPRSPGSDGSPTLQLRPTVHHGRPDRRVCRHSPYRSPPSAARFFSKDGQQTIWFRGGLTVRISSSPPASPVFSPVPSMLRAQRRGVRRECRRGCRRRKLFRKLQQYPPADRGYRARSDFASRMLLIAISGLASPSSCQRRRQVASAGRSKNASRDSWEKAGRGCRSPGPGWVTSNSAFQFD